MKFILQINGSESDKAEYVGWTPAKCTLSIDGYTGDLPMPVTITPEYKNKDGRIDLYLNNSPSELPVQKIEHDFQTKNELVFYVAGKFGHPSVAEKDTFILVKSNNSDLELKKDIMVRVRKNANKLSDDEITLFLKTFVDLSSRPTRESYNGRFTVTPSSLLDEIVLMHTYDAQFEIHSRESFHPWHRAYLMHLEREMQNVRQEVTIPYWKFDDKAENVFTEKFIGKIKKCTPDENDQSFDDSMPEFSPDNPMFPYIDHTIWGPLTRSYRDTDPAEGKSNPKISDESDIISYSDEFIRWCTFEERKSHNPAHNAFNGRVVDVGKDPVDPLFFLMHSNVDRLWALWQHTYDRFDAEHSKTYPLPYSYEGLAGEKWTDANPKKFDLRAGFFKADSYDLGNFADDELWPWGLYRGSKKDELTGEDKDAIHRLSRPWRKYAESGYGGAVVPELFLKFPESPISIYPQEPPRVKDTIDYQGRMDLKSTLGFDYDCIPYFNKDNTLLASTPYITREQYNKAFLNKKLTVEERLESAKSALIFSKNDNAAVLSIISDKNENSKIRLQAVKLSDETSEVFLDIALKVLKEETSSIDGVVESNKIEFVSEIIHTIFTAKRSNRSFASRRPFFFDILRGLLYCNNVTLRRQAFEILASQGDGKVEEILYAQVQNELKNENDYSALISTVDALFLLRQNPKNQHTGIFYKLAEESQNTEIRKAAIAGLDNAPEYEDYLREIVKNKSEGFEIRWAGAKSLRHLDAEAMNDLAVKIVAKPEGEDGDGMKLFRNSNPDPDEVDFKAGLLNMLTFTGDVSRMRENENLKSILKEVIDPSAGNKANFRSSFEVFAAEPLSSEPTIIEQMAARLLDRIEGTNHE
ncbi:tyrosinase family protein [Chryseobacterium sp. MYb264]|uniref:tyrosinase family protein n=1 Tax=Chryseobacterium sp. MYb264 TaxID=2745153 RepID=UPI002E13D0F8|nr:tyrosinase family protein [Chryseobacterium sp. MYb264]